MVIIIVFNPNNKIFIIYITFFANSNLKLDINFFL